MDEGKAVKVPAAGDIDRVLHEPARLLIMINLYIAGKADYPQLMKAAALTWGNVSSHLMKLEAAGHVDIHKTFVDRRPYTQVQITEKGRAALHSYGTTMQEVLTPIMEEST